MPDLSFLQNFVQWFVQNPLTAATLLYITGLISVLIYTYFDPHDQHKS